jgi:hypothetical protein
MGLFGAWIVFPALLVVLAYGCGAVVERASGRALPIGLRLPCGTALMIGVLDLATDWTKTVPAAVPVLCVLAAVGILLRPPWRLSWSDGAARACLIVAVVVFAVYSAPIVMSGLATWAGYAKLDDTATWLALVDRTLTSGHTLAGLSPSTYQDTLSEYLTNGYPVGSFLPMGLGHQLLGQEIAWLPDPWMAFMAAMLALSLERIAARTLGRERSRWQTPVIAILAAQSALLYSYYLWGGIKEMAGAMLVATFVASLPWRERERERKAVAMLRPLAHVRRLRAAIPAAIVVWAIFAALTSGGVVWLIPGGILTALLSLRRKMRLPPRRVLAGALGAGVVIVGGAAYLALRPGGFVEKFKGVLTGSHELGNLIAPLHLQQIAGIWLSGDFRVLPTDTTATNILIAVAIVLGTGGLITAVWRSRSELALYVLCALAGGLLVFFVGSPWLGGKALASASPAVPFVALIACAMLRRRGYSALGLIAGAAIAAGIVWSNALAYHEAFLAPRVPLAQLGEIGHEIAGQGPTFLNDLTPVGVRHFLREAEPESPSEFRSRQDLLVSGKEVPDKGASPSIDQFQSSGLLVYRTIVLHRSPAESRPPSPYKLVLRDSEWEVWQRPVGGYRSVLAQMPLGDATHPGAVPSCAAVGQFAHTSGARGLEAQPVSNPTVVYLGEEPHPKGWASGERNWVDPAESGTERVTVDLRQAGRYGIWLGGTFSGPITISIDGIAIGTQRYELSEQGDYVPFGVLPLGPGEYKIGITYSDGEWWRPGSGVAPSIGPLFIQRELPEQHPMIVPVTNARSLCGHTLDWIEALGP